MLRTLVTLLCVAAATASSPSSAQKNDFSPKSETYICPHDPVTGLDCYLDAVTHLYTMCRNVKSIEIIEFGHAKAQEGTNGAKSDSCVEKQRINIARPYQAALREATGWKEVVDGLRGLQQFWLDAMANLKWRSGEADDDYQDRVYRVYDDLSVRIESVRVGFSTAPDNAPAPKVAPKAKPVAAAKPN